jgi:hypothetical protein
MERSLAAEMTREANIWIRLHYGTSPNRKTEIERKEQVSPLTSLIGTARRGAACRVVLEGWQAQSCRMAPIRRCGDCGEGMCHKQAR